MLQHGEKNHFDYVRSESIFSNVEVITVRNDLHLFLDTIFHIEKNNCVMYCLPEVGIIVQSLTH